MKKIYILPVILMIAVLGLALTVSASVTTLSQNTYTSPRTGASATVIKYYADNSYGYAYGYNVQTSYGGYYNLWNAYGYGGGRVVTGSGYNPYGAGAFGITKTPSGYVYGAGRVVYYYDS